MPSIKIYPDNVYAEQQHIVGIKSPDKWGDDWSYVEFPAGTYKHGQVLADQVSSDLLSSSGLGTLTADADAGSSLLEDTDEFSGDDFRGAIGHIVEGVGVGQSFVILEVKDSDTLVVYVLDTKGQGWETALDTTSKYRLSLPGRVKVATSAVRVRGVLQMPDFTVPTNEKRYGFVRMTGIGRGLVDASGTALVDRVTATTGGLIVGTTGNAYIGYATHGDLDGTVDSLMPIDFNIINNARSFRSEKDKYEPYHDVII